MNIPVLYLTPPPRRHSAYSLSLLEASRQGAIVDFSQISNGLHPRRPATGNQHHATSRGQVSQRGMHRCFFSFASWRKLGGALGGGAV